MTFCKPRFAMDLNQSLRTPFSIRIYPPSTPSSIANSTFGISDVFLLCRYMNGNSTLLKITDCQMLHENYGILIEKSVNFYYVCFNVEHPQIVGNKRKKIKMIYEFWLYNRHPSEFTLFLTAENDVPTG